MPSLFKTTRHNINTAFDIMGLIPGVSTFSGGSRVFYGACKAVANVGIAAISTTACPFSAKARTFTIKRLGGTLDGIMHSIKGATESVPVLGNIGIWMYYAANQSWKCFQGYGSEESSTANIPSQSAYPPELNPFRYSNNTPKFWDPFKT